MLNMQGLSDQRVKQQESYQQDSRCPAWSPTCCGARNLILSGGTPASCSAASTLYASSDSPYTTTSPAAGADTSRGNESSEHTRLSERATGVRVGHKHVAVS